MFTKAGVIASTHKAGAVSWSFSKTVTIDATKVSSDQVNFPILFSGVYDGTGGEPDLRVSGSGGSVQNVNGYDIAFYSDASLTTLLSFEAESWDSTTGEINYWIKIPALSSSINTVLYLAYGNASIAASLSSASNVWTNGFVAVYHLPNGTVLTALDSTSNDNDGTLTNTPTATAGKIDGAANLVRASSQHINLGNPASLQITGDLTIECWINAATLPTMSLVTKDKNTGGRAYTFDVAAGLNRFYINGGGGSDIIMTGVAISASTWYYMVGVYDNAGTLDIYKNGSSAATQVTGTTTSIPSATANVLIGRREFAANEDNYDGIIDEVRVSNVTRTAGWILTSYNSQNNPSTFYTIT